MMGVTFLTCFRKRGYPERGDSLRKGRGWGRGWGSNSGGNYGFNLGGTGVPEIYTSNFDVW